VPAAAALPSLPTRTSPDFPHAEHKEIACAECHEFVPTSDGPFAVPVTKASATSCLPCHGKHDQIAGGACRKCHDFATDADYHDFLGAAPPPDRAPAPRPWPTTSAFDHFSPGHQRSTEKDCATCHRDQSAVSALRDLRSLTAPTEADAACRTCHLDDRHRYHWR
jgi:hypothetical protein